MPNKPRAARLPGVGVALLETWRPGPPAGHTHARGRFFAYFQFQTCHGRTQFVLLCSPEGDPGPAKVHDESKLENRRNLC
jgi:hypothetical protein